MAGPKTFVVDCPDCSAKVAATLEGEAKNRGWNDDAGEPYGERLVCGKCPHCRTLIAGRQFQTHFEGYEGDEHDRWTDIVRIYPKPPKIFSSHRIPAIVVNSLSEADKVLQVGAHVAACVMFGRALEALCRDTIEAHESATTSTGAPPKKKHIMLDQGIKRMRDLKLIDDRLYDWSQHLRAFRNLAAHASEGFTVTRSEAEDLQAFVHAITEYVYDLTDRYEEFKAREAEKSLPRRSAKEMFAGLVEQAPETPKAE